VTVAVAGSQIYGGGSPAWSAVATSADGVLLPVSGVSCSSVDVAGASVAISASLDVRADGYPIDPASCVASLGDPNYTIAGFTGAFAVNPYPVSVRAVSA